MNCAACGARATEVGLLCEDCSDEIAPPVGLTPEKITASIAQPVGAALIDTWGRPHALEARTMIGRSIEGSGLAIHEGSISRHHAHLSQDGALGAWTLRDLGSANGTFANEQPVRHPTPIRHGDRIVVAQIGFYFVVHGDPLPEVVVDPLDVGTIRPASRATPPGGYREITASDLDALAEFPERERTDVGVVMLEMRMAEPTGGGGGLLEVEGRQVQLTATQLELVSLLVKRMVDESHQPSEVRGFVRSSELIGRLSWDTREPGESHVKQLVRRVRRALIKAGVGDLVESRHRFGYRLRVLPKLS
jgi:hypothetical protein